MPKKLIPHDLDSKTRGNNGKQVAIASQTDIYPRITAREDQKRRAKMSLN